MHTHRAYKDRSLVPLEKCTEPAKLNVSLKQLAVSEEGDLEDLKRRVWVSAEGTGGSLDFPSPLLFHHHFIFSCITMAIMPRLAGAIVGAPVDMQMGWVADPGGGGLPACLLRACRC